MRGQIDSQGANAVKSTLHAPSLHFIVRAHTEEFTQRADKRVNGAGREEKRLCDDEASHFQHISCQSAPSVPTVGLHSEK